MKITYLVHGFPPRENAGTEQHTKCVVEHMKARGHQVQVIAATRAPGRLHGEILSHEPDCHRIVNNIPARPLIQQECDRHIQNKIEQLLNRFKPDIVHIQHIQFLSVDISIDCPTAFTFHDSWAWCPAGGLELRWPEQQNCVQPSPSECASCSAQWHPQLSPQAHRLMSLAQHLNPIISSERLHEMWKWLPTKWRARVSTERGAPPPAPKAVTQRNQKLHQLIEGCQLKISPSRYLAKRAMAHGFSEIKVLPHALDERIPHQGGNGILYLGTISHHKGADLVAEAINVAFPHSPPKSMFFGLPVDPQMAAKIGAKPPLDRTAVWSALKQADVLVMGSRWRENAPLVILEARAAGCPVIAPRIGGIPEIITDGVDGFLYEPNDVSSCAAVLQRWHSGPKLTPTNPPLASQRMDTLESWYRQLCG